MADGTLDDALTAPGPPASAPNSSVQPAVATPGPSTAQGPHAGLINFIQSSLVGLGAFARSAATGGREGGVEDVQKFQANEQAMALRAQQAKREADTAQQAKEDHELRMKIGTADLNMKSAQYAQLVADAPLHRQLLYSQVQNNMLDLLEKKGILPSKAVDMLEGASTSDHATAVSTAADGNLTDNHVIPTFGPQGAGKPGGSTAIIPNNSTANVSYSSQDLAPTLTSMQNVIDNAKKELGDPNNAQLKNAQSQLDFVKQGLAQGGTISHHDFMRLKENIGVNVEQQIQQKEHLTEAQQKQANLQKTNLENQAAARPKSLEDATGRLVQAQQAFKANPTPENKLSADAAQTSVNTFQRTEVQTAARKAYASKQAELNAMDANEAKNLPTLIDAAKNYQLDPDKIFSMRGNQGAMFKAELLKADPTYSAANYKARFDTVRAFSPAGKEGQQVIALNTFAGHAQDAMQLVRTLRDTGSPLINAPLNKVSQSLGNDKLQPTKAALMAAKDEYLNFLKAGHAATKEEIERVEELGSINSTLAQNEATLKQMAQTINIRANSLNHQYKATMGTDYPNMFSEEAKQAMRDLGHPVSGDKSSFDPKKDVHPMPQ